MNKLTYTKLLLRKMIFFFISIHFLHFWKSRNTLDLLCMLLVLRYCELQIRIIMSLKVSHFKSSNGCHNVSRF